MFLVSRKLTSYLNFHTEVFPLATPAYSLVMVKPSIYVSDVSNSKVRQFVGRQPAQPAGLLFSASRVLVEELRNREENLGREEISSPFSARFFQQSRENCGFAAKPLARAKTIQPATQAKGVDVGPVRQNPIPLAFFQWQNLNSTVRSDTLRKGRMQNFNVNIITIQ